MGVVVVNMTLGSDQRLAVAAHVYVDFARRRPAMFELAFGRPVPGYRASDETTAALRLVFRTHIVGLIEEWSESNDPGATARESIDRARIWWSAIHGLVTLEQAGHGAPSETDDLINGLVSSLTSGWRATRPPSAPS